MRVGAHRLAALGIGVVPIVLFAGCPAGDDHSTTGGGGGAAGAGGALTDADAGEPWDPVWHETEPKDWPVVGPENNPDCGPGCRIALNVPIPYQDFSRRANNQWVVSESSLGIAFSAIGSADTHAIPREPDSLIFPGLWGDLTSYVRNLGVGKGQIEIASLVTGETKIVFRYPEQGKGEAMSSTALNGKYVFWAADGIWAKNLQTGEAKRIAFGGCWSYSTTEDALICEDGKIYAIYPDTAHDGGFAESEMLYPGPELQTHGNGSPDHSRYVWVDYRDPPGPGSDNFYDRSGGEIYMHDFNTKKNYRLTFDSPGTPRGKWRPTVTGDLVVWDEVPNSSGTPNPQTYQGLAAGVTALATLDLKTGERCQVANAALGGPMSVHGRHVYGGWLDKAANETRLVDIDLDYPGFQWECVSTPGWSFP